MKILLRTIACLFFILLLGSASVWRLYAQSPRLYTVQQGLPTSLLGNIFFDRDNFMWIASPSGLIRFDGMNFHVYRSDRSNELALHDDNINCVFEDVYKNHWVGASDGLYYFCRKENKFVYYPLLSDGASGSVSRIVSHPLRSDILLVASNGFGMYAFNVKSRQFDPELSRFLDKGSSSYISNLYVDSQNWLWKLNTKGFEVLDLKSNEPVEISMTDEVRHLCSSSVFIDVLEDKRNHVVYLTTIESGLFEYDLNHKALRRSPNLKLQQLPITEVVLAPTGQLMLGTEGSGVYIYDRNADQVDRLHLNNSPFDITKSKVHSMTFDSEGNLWMSLYHQGLLVVPKPDENMFYYVANEDPAGNSLGCVTSFITLPNGMRVVSVDGGGVMLSGAEMKCRTFDTTNSDLTSNAVLDVEASHGNDFYIATYSGGVFAYRNGVIMRPSGLKAFDSLRAMCVAYDPRSSKLYIGSNGAGVYVYDEKKDVCEHLDLPYNNWIEDVVIDTLNDCLWVGSAVSVYRYSLHSGETEMLKVSFGESVHVHGLHKTSAALWIASSEGLFYYKFNDKKVVKVDIESSMGDKNVMSITSDTSGDIWFAMSQAIGCYHIQDGSIDNFYSSAIAMVGGFNHRSAANDISGMLAFGGDNGFITFNPRKMRSRERAISEVYFSHLWVSNNVEEYSPLSPDNYLDASLWSAKTLTLPADKNSFSISFAAMEYADPLSVNYAYRMSGYDDEWHELHGGGHNAVFSNLPPGNYDLQVRAYINNSKIRGSFKQLRVVILPPWYKTWWAYLIYIFILGMLIAAVYRHWHDLNEEKKRFLQAQHQEQMKEAKLQLFTSISHDIKTPLTLIISPLRKLLEKKCDNATRTTYDLMYRNAMRIMMLVNQQMDVRKIDNGQLHLKMQELPLYDYIHEVMSYFQNVASLYQINYQLRFHCDEKLRMWFDPNHFDKVLFNLLSNAFKFTGKQGEVCVSVASIPTDGLGNEGKVKISVFNSGPMISDDDLTHIFERFYQGNQTDKMTGTGIGLNLAKQIVELHHGEISVCSVEQRGVEFSVVLPLGCAHLSESEKATAESFEKPKQIQKTVAEADEKKPLTPNRQELIEQEVRNIEVLGDEPPADVEEPVAVSDQTPSDSDQTAVTDKTSNADKQGKTDKQEKPKTLLLVDDDLEFLDYVKNELSEYNVVLANDGDTAWTQLLTYVPDVVVTDLKMPGSDGFQLCQRIKKNPDTDNIPVIVLTAENNEEAEVQAVKCQADRFLNKPVNVQLLRGAIAQSVKVRENILNKIRRSDMGYDFSGVKMDSADEKLLQKVVECIQKNIGDTSLSVVELSKVAGISRVHLNRKLKELIGSTPSLLIKSIRLKQAAHLLLNSDATISEIAYSVGFSSPSYFTSTFSSYFGMSPKDFIANYHDNPNDDKLKELLK